MILSHARLALLTSVVFLAGAPAFASNVRSASANGHTRTAHRLAQSRHRSHRVRGQQAIEPERVTQIQQALIREHYLNTPADGKWDATTVAAMQKYQADHGWQTKLMPDSRALLKLGLGPDYSGAINAQGSNFAPPPAAGDSSPQQNSGFVAASGVHQ